MKMTKTKLAKGFTLVELLVVIAIIAALAALSTPVVLKQQKKANATTAVNNAKQIFLLLFEYDQENAAYPTGSDSNVALGTLISEGYTTSEEIFFAKSPISKKPDGDISTSSAILTTDELGFKYVDALSAGKASGLPLLGAPFSVKAANGYTMDAEAYGGSAVVLFNDGSARTIRIANDLAPGGGDPNVFASTKLGSSSNGILALDSTATDPTP